MRIGQSTPTGATTEALSRVLRGAAVLAILYVAIRVSIAGVASAAGWAPLPLELELLDERLPILFRAHMVFSALALLLIAAALATRAKATRWHRPIGRIAAVAVILGGLTALPSALLSVASPATFLIVDSHLISTPSCSASSTSKSCAGIFSRVRR